MLSSRSKAVSQMAHDTTLAPASRRGPWLFAPAIGEGSRSGAVLWTVIRMFVGVMWAYNVAWKKPPDFGLANKGGLYAFTNFAVEHPVFGPFTWVIETLVLPNFVLFGWGVLVAETLLAVSLLSGSFVRVFAVIGALQALAIGLSVANAPHEWPWAYALMVLVHLALLVGVTGRYLAVDAVRARASSGAGLAWFWGLLSVGLAALAIASLLGEPLTGKGKNLNLPDLEFGLGAYNLLGAAFLLVVGLALLVWSFARRRLVALIGSVIAAAAAISLRVQIGYSTPLLGGEGTAATYFLTLAVVAVALAARPKARVDHNDADDNADEHSAEDRSATHA